MPSHYAHYRFGMEILPDLPADARKAVKRFRRLFDVGLQGPDPFFYYQILWKTPIYKLGKKFHRMTGEEFFTMACRRYRLAHYCLDSRTHPKIHALTEDGKVNHTELETEFDRYLLALDGKPQPHTFDASRHIRLTKGEAETASRFFPPATPEQMARSVENMADLTKWLVSPGGLGKWSLDLGIRITGDAFRHFVRTVGPNPNCAHLNPEMEACYDRARRDYPRMAARLAAQLSHNAGLGEDFAEPFG